jgi:hypothetical protein
MSAQEIPQLTTGNPITLTEGVDWTTNWRTWCLENGFTEQNMLRAFFIPLGDLEAIVKTSGAGGCRAYLALERADDPSTVKLVLVPTEPNQLIGFGKDIIEPLPIDAVKNDDEELVSIYDLTCPCPRFCDFESPLFGDPIPPTSAM